MLGRTRSKTSSLRRAQSAPRNSHFRARSSSPSPESPPPALSPEETVRDSCERALELLETLGTTFGDCLVAICYGDSALRGSNRAMRARASIYETDNLRAFLNNSYRPSRPPSGHGKRPVAGSKTIQRFASATVQETFKNELSKFSEGYTIDQSQLANTDYMATITSTSLHDQIKMTCPELYDMLSGLTGSAMDEDDEEEDEDEDVDEALITYKKPKKKHPHFNIVFQVTSMAFRLNRQRNVLQKYLSVYVQVKHTNKDIVDLLQQAGITMSYSWMRRTISNLSVDIRNQARLAVREKPYGASHDNIRVTYPVASQRGDNQSVSDNGTATTVYIYPDSARALMNPDDFQPFNRTLKAQRIAGTASRLAWSDLLNPVHKKYNRISSIHDVLDLFCMIPELSLSDIWKSDKLKRPTGPQQLPHGPEHRLRQYMLPTTNIDESSYSGNSQVIPFALKYLGLDTEPERSRLALERLVIWVGDQMTAQHCRQVKSYRQESINSINRWDPFLFIYGGFHAQMTLGHSILEAFRGANTGPTFGSDIILLSRTGLQKVVGKKRLDFHTVDEFLLHEAEAHFRGLFMHLTGCKTGDDISAWIKGHTANDVYQLASDALCGHASSGALELEKSDDEMRQVIIQRQRDLLLYYSVRRAYKHGDIDCIEALLPELLFYSIGAGNSNYAKEVFELLQLLIHETTPAVRDVILKHGLVVNKLGRADSFYPVDQHQEFNNGGIRDYGPPPQNASWKQYGEISGVIPFFMDVVEHVEGNITGICRSRIHKNPKREKDVQALIAAHTKHQLHEVVPGRVVPRSDKPKDARKFGVQAVCDRGAFEKYHNKREIYFKATTNRQMYEDIETPPPSPTIPPTHTS